MNPTRKLLTTLAAGAVLAAGVQLANQPDANACGGFFCNAAQPVDQSAERIIFAQNDDDTVTAVVQIAYQGPSSDFSWLLPVSGTPEVGVSSNTVFTNLQRSTDPSYRLETTVQGDCKQYGGMNNGSCGVCDGAVDAGASNNADAGSSVDVVDQGTVGPYDYTTISVTPGNDDPAQAALDWLTQNGYDLTDIGPNLLRAYLEDGMNLIAFKLTKNAQSGDIRPVTLTYPAELPMIPIKLTAVAARPDMGVLVWVLGDGRAIPQNYKSLVLNDAAINWFYWRSNYDDVIAQAADEADGQGFVTEYAKSTSELPAVYPDSAATTWQQINDPAQWQDRHGELLFSAMGSFGRWDGFRTVLTEAVPMPDGVSLQQFMNCPRCYYDGTETTIDGFSPQVFLDSLADNVVNPVKDAQDILDSQPYVTRLYTTMSPPEMTLDPVFDFNPSMADVDNQHVAQQTVFCNPSVTRYEAPWSVELPSGEVVNGSGQQWPLAAGDGLPATREIRQDHNTGSGDVVEDNSQQIHSTLAAHNESVDMNPSTNTGGVSDGGGCNTTGGGSAGGAALLLLTGLGWVLVRRRSA